MKALSHTFDGLPIWPRLTLAGLLWGMLCGFLVAVTVMLSMVGAGVASDGLGWQGLPNLVAGVIVSLGVGGAFGTTLGGIIGALTGVVGGTVLVGFIRIASPRSAAWITVVTVLVIQVGVGVLLLEGTWIGLAMVAPVLAVVPMSMTAFSAADHWASTRTVA